MAVTLDEVRAALDPEEPNYRKAQEFGPEALPHLSTLVEEGNPLLAAKATYLASLLGNEGSHAIVETARVLPMIVMIIAGRCIREIGILITTIDTGVEGWRIDIRWNRGRAATANAPTTNAGASMRAAVANEAARRARTCVAATS